MKYHLPCVKVSRTGWSGSGKVCVPTWRERPAHQQPHAEKEQQQKRKKEKKKKVAFKSLSCKTTVNGYLHTQLRLTRGLSLFSFWSSRIWQHWKASAVTCAAANRAATRVIVGNGVFHQTAADIFWHDAMLFDCEGRFFRGSNFSQVALQPVLRWLTADNAQLRIHAVTTI